MEEPRLTRARRALEGLSIGDAFGERFFASPLAIHHWLERRTIDEPGPWRWTDDTAMALALVDTLERFDELDSADELDLDHFVERLHERYRKEPWRGYAYGAHHLFEQIEQGMSWQIVAASLFGGQGSFGNGGAMRVAPLGAYFADDLERVVVEARRSASVTHAHPEGQAGSVAIAIAAAVAWQTREASEGQARERLWVEVLARTPAGETRAGIERAHALGPDTPITAVVDRLGNGSKVSSQDTVPLCLWAIGKHLRDYELALWTTVGALGDRDTTCAIVGGVVALASDEPSIPAHWRARREPLG